MNIYLKEIWAPLPVGLGLELPEDVATRLRNGS